MNDQQSEKTVTGADTQANQGIGFPRIYDLLLLILTAGRERKYRKEVIELARIAPGQHVLDIGCGTGTQAIETWRACQPGGAVTGTDISEKMLAVARRKASRAGVDVAFHHADAAELPFENERFDVATITTVLHMVPKSRLHLCVSEASRVLKPRGQLLLIDYAGELKDRKHWTATCGMHGRFNLHAMHELLSAEGFRNIESGPIHWLDLHFMRGMKDGS